MSEAEKIRAMLIWELKAQKLNGPPLTQFEQGWNAALEHVWRATEPTTQSPTRAERGE